MKYLLILGASFLFIVTGCSNVSEENTSQEIEEETKEIVQGEGDDEAITTESHSYAVLVKVKGKEYVRKGEAKEGEYKIDAKIGEVQETVPIEIAPKDNFSSNFLPTGTAIYSVKGNDQLILTNSEDDTTYRVFKSLK